MKRHLKLLFASLSLALPLTFNACSEPEEKPAPTPAVIKVLSPAAGTAYKVTDNVTVIAESDYSKFASGIRISFSVDEGKTYQFLADKVRKEDISKDTLIFNFSTEMPGTIAPGTKMLFQVSEYNKKFFAVSPSVTFN